MKQIKISEDNPLTDQFNNAFLVYIKAVQDIRFKKAKESALNSSSFFKNKINQEEEEDSKNIALIFTVFFKGLEDFTEIMIETHIDGWNKNYKKIEDIWLTLCNCKERLEFATKYIEGSYIDDFFTELNKLSSNYEEAYGKGLYASSEITSEKEICNICEKDVRACLHIRGEIYNGKISKTIQVNPVLKAVSVLEEPKDPRCRIWFWNKKEDGSIPTVLYNLEDAFSFIDK